MSAIKYISFGIFLFILMLTSGIKKSFGDTDETISPAVQVLLGKLFSQGERDRINAALSLANYNYKIVTQSLITVVKNDSNDMVKRVALRSLGRIGSLESLPVILESIVSESIGVKVEAMGAAVNFSTPAVTYALINEANSSNPVVRQKAVTYLGSLEYNSNKVVDIIIEKLGDVSEGVRVSACKVLGKKKVSEAIPALSEVLRKDRSEVVREYAALAFGEIKGADAEKVLKEALDDSSPLVRITAARSLARLGSSAGLSEAIGGIKSPNAKIRAIACNIIGMVGDMNTNIFLQQAVGDFDRRVQRAAKEALRELEKRWKMEDGR